MTDNRPPRPVQLRRREFDPPLTAQEAAQRAEELTAAADLLPVGGARATVLKEAAKFRALAQMKNFLKLKD